MLSRLYDLFLKNGRWAQELERDDIASLKARIEQEKQSLKDMEKKLEEIG
jgi:hypothetical protein